MTLYNKKPTFKVKVNYPTYENYDEYEHRKAETVAKILVNILSLCDISKLINRLDCDKKR